jgi:hypothetical protein
LGRTQARHQWELLNVITTAATGSAKLSQSDRVLFTVCEFLASARNGTLVAHLAEHQLREAEIAFTALGLSNAARTVHRARLDLTEPNAPIPLAQIIENMKNALADDDESVDQVLAEFAAQQARGRIDRSD